MKLRCILWCAVSTGAQAEDDKVSLPQQETDGRKLAEQNGWEIVDVLRIPGHSRSYIDFHDLAADASKSGIDAFDKLSRHWENRDFDILVLRDGERLARTQSLMAYIVEKTIALGARLYSMADGWIDHHNFRMFISMAGYKASGDVDRLVKARKRGMTARAERGLPVSPKIPLSHSIIREPISGKVLGLEVNEEKRRLWTDLAELILEGVAWKKIENELYTRYGHVDQTARPYKMYTMYVLITNPMFWGHTAQGFRTKRNKQTKYYGLWVFDETEPLPEGVTIYRNTVPPVYTGELAERVKAELRRRTGSIKGRAKPHKTHRYTSLFVCGECGASLSVYTNRKGKHQGLRCNMSMLKNRNEVVCTQKKILAQSAVDHFLNGLLSQLLEGITVDDLLQTETSLRDVQRRVETTRADINKRESQIGTLIYEQSQAPEVAQNYYRQKITELATEVEKLQSILSSLERKAATSSQTAVIQAGAMEEIRALGLARFWQLPNGEINQLLHRLLGNKQFVVLDKQIIGVADRTRRRRRKTQA